MLWNAEDATLEGREYFQMGVMEEFKEALGRVGDKAESYMNLQYFKERVSRCHYKLFIQHVHSPLTLILL